MKALVLGCGSIGRRHIANLLSVGVTVEAYNRSQERAEMARGRFDIAVFQSVKDLNPNAYDIVLICVVSSLHLKWVEWCFANKINCFVEKPLSHSNQGLLQLLSLRAQFPDVKCFVGANLRFHPGPRQVKRLVNQGILGEPVFFNMWGGMYLPDWHPEEDYKLMYSARLDQGGGVINDFIHELDLVNWIFGVPAKVAAVARNSGLLGIETEDLVDVLLSYRNGFQGTIHLDYLQKPVKRGLFVYCHRGWVEWSIETSEVRYKFHDSDQIFAAAFDKYQWTDDMYLAQQSCLVKNLGFKNGVDLSTDASMICSLDEGVEAVQLASNIRLAALEGKFVDAEITH